jgi:hypothetical protein
MMICRYQNCNHNSNHKSYNCYDLHDIHDPRDIHDRYDPFKMFSVYRHFVILNLFVFSFCCLDVMINMRMSILQKELNKFFDYLQNL